MEQMLIGMFTGFNGYDLLLLVSLLLMTAFFIAGEIKIRFSKPAR